MDIEGFKDPGKEYRPSPFWSWNDDLENEELRWQVRQMNDQGFGGYFMHSRTGLKTPYLSEEWFDRIKNTLDEGKKYGMESWLYDEDKFPSGFAGGLITEQNSGYAAKYLKKLEIRPEDIGSCLEDPKTVAVYMLGSGDGIPAFQARISNISDIPVIKEKDIRFCAFKIFSHIPTNWYNGESYVDLLDDEAVDCFIESTHEQYYKRFKDDIGGPIPGIFTDEPCYINEGADTMPWTTGFEDYFRSTMGYDLLEQLPSLFYGFDGYLKLRYHFFYAMTKKFIDAYSKKVYNYCDARGLKYTGHYVEEDSLHRQTLYIGAAMPHYQYMHIPGIDHLRRDIDNPLILKQCSSVGHQFGRNRILCEIFGVSGHSMSFEDQKWIADFHFALGITFLCQHLVLYSMTGERKRDFPPTISYHQPYWKYYKYLNDYFARAGWICSQGDYAADTLVLHPIGSVWADFEKKHRFHMGKYDIELRKLLDVLLSAQVGFDLGDEIIMEENASVMTEGGRTYIRIAKKGRYSLVIIPPSMTWSKKTYGLLKDFILKGGHVVFAGEIPGHIEGEENHAAWQELLKHHNVYTANNDFDDMTGTVGSLLDGETIVRDKAGMPLKNVYIHSRKDGCLHYCFIANTSRTDTYDAVINMPVSGRIMELDMMTGDIRDKAATSAGGFIRIETRLHPAGSCAYVIDTSEETADTALPKESTVTQTKLPGIWKARKLHKNSITLDYCRYSIDGGCWSAEMPVWKVRAASWQRSGMEGYKGLQPWIMDKKGLHETKAFDLGLRFEFNSEITGINASIVIEKASDWIMKINGCKIDTDAGSWYWDKQFGSIDISRHIRRGTNEIEIGCVYKYGIELEDIYITGDFGVRQTGYRQYTLTNEPESLADGSWVYQGYPFYSGNIQYMNTMIIDKRPGSRYFIKLDGPKGSLFKITVNGSGPAFMISHPWEADITDFCISGENEICIEAAGSLRNTFGPLHHRLAVQTVCGPLQFADEDNWFEPYHFEDYGLIKGAVLLEKRSNG